MPCYSFSRYFEEPGLIRLYVAAVKAQPLHITFRHPDLGTKIILLYSGEQRLTFLASFFVKRIEPFCLF